jgi:hypothetical protein
MFYFLHYDSVRLMRGLWRFSQALAHKRFSIAQRRNQVLLDSEIAEALNHLTNSPDDDSAQ